MCLAIPGKLVEITADPAGVKMGRANFGGIVKQVCLEYTPEAQAGDYVLVHVGFALSKVNEQEAARTYQLLEEMKQLGELDVPEVNPFEATAATSAGHPERNRGIVLRQSEVTSRDSSTPKAFGAQNDKLVP
jgi:hydrogenase expression/formation protein HypC